MSSPASPLFREKSYRKAIDRIVSTRKHLDSRMRFSRLAEHMRIQKSYLSKVLKGAAHLSSDQLHLGCEYLELTPLESNYLQLLLEWEKSSLPARKQELEKKLLRFREKQLETKSHLQAKSLEKGSAGEAGGPSTKPSSIAEVLAERSIGVNEYYIDPLYQLVHMGLTIPSFQEEPKRLAEALGVSGERMESALQVLERIGVIQVKTSSESNPRARGEIEVLRKTLHLSRESPLYRPWRAQLRLWALQKLLELGSKKAYTF